jgi:DNA polymerase III subunit gamma/tau
MSSINNVNLARKWRSKNFDQVIGQDLTLRILKNSLYLNHYFPVYLFSGQHGCGKTTTARIFASAVNCEKLSFFQQDPKNHSIPCLECKSCQAMNTGTHPDFIEIDGASNTGVDNVRHIIDVSAFLPLMGRKKIYLIDEAHMLSKAAFNAFLKILEEPPASVLFMLATTELHKIIDTVRSRSFHLFFRSVTPTILLQHLETICTEEHINYEQQGILVIVKQSKGSVRDAINLLEQVRFESNSVTKKNVLAVLGHVDDETLIAFFEKITSGKPHELLQFIQEHSLDSYNADILWKSLTELLNASIWISYGLTPNNFAEFQIQLTKIVQQCEISYFNECLKILYEHELAFSKTGARWQLFELLLLHMCCALSSSPERIQKAVTNSSEIKNQTNKTLSKQTSTVTMNTNVQQRMVEGVVDDKNGIWNSFIAQIELFDPLLSSIFKQGRYAGFDMSSSTLTVFFPKEFTFFNEMLESSSSIWKPLLVSLLGKQFHFNAVFRELGSGQAPLPEKTSTPISFKSQKNNVLLKNEQASVSAKPDHKNFIDKKSTPAKSLDISDKEQWKKATMLKNLFSGTIQEVQEGNDE